MNVVLPEHAQRAQAQAQQKIMQKMAQEQVLMKAAEVVEKQLDDNIKKLDNLTPDDLAEIRRKRIQELKAHQQRREEWKRKGHGKYQEVGNQEDWFREVKENERVVCHFYRASTWRCQIVDRHLEELAAEHMETRFIKINAEKCHYLVENLNIVLMPTIIMTKNNKTEDRVEGFDSLGGRDDFTTEALQRRLAHKGLIDLDPDMLMSAGSGKKRFANASNPEGKPIYQTVQREWPSDDDFTDTEDEEE